MLFRSMSHTGLGFLGNLTLVLLFAPTSLVSECCLPLSCLDEPAAVEDEASSGWDNLCEENGKMLDGFPLKGFSNASLMRLTLTWPKPGSWRSCVEDARAMSAKL